MWSSNRIFVFIIVKDVFSLKICFIVDCSIQLVSVVAQETNFRMWHVFNSMKSDGE